MAIWVRVEDFVEHVSVVDADFFGDVVFAFQIADDAGCF
jgi:hypothetical protein